MFRLQLFEKIEVCVNKNRPFHYIQGITIINKNKLINYFTIENLLLKFR